MSEVGAAVAKDAAPAAELATLRRENGKAAA